MPETLRERIERHEGLRLVPYRDSKGNLTIGYGHLIKPGETFTILTQSEAEQLLDADIAGAEDDVLHMLPWTAHLPDAVRGVLIEMAFQMGLRGLLGFHEALSYAYQGDFTAMAQAMRDSLWARHDSPARAEELASIVQAAA